HPLALEGETHRALLDDAVDVVSPRIAIEQAIDRQLELIVQAPQQPTHAARRLAAALGQDAVVLLPEAILVEARPDRAFLDVQDELRVALAELDHARLDDRRDRVAAGAHAPKVNLVTVVDDRQVPDDLAAL